MSMISMGSGLGIIYAQFMVVVYSLTGLYGIAFALLVTSIALFSVSVWIDEETVKPNRWYAE